MDTVIATILPVFGILLIGYLAARLGFMAEAAVDGLAHFVFNFAVPLLLFRSFAGAGLPASIPWALPAAFYLGAFITFLLGIAAGGILFRRGVLNAVSYGSAAAYGNTVLMGIPIVLVTYGEAASVPLFVIMGIHTLVMVSMISLGYAVANGKKRSFAETFANLARDLVRNPILIALLAGLLYGRFAPPLPYVLDEIARLLGETAMPAALFAMGGTLSRYRLGGQAPHAIALAALKLAIFPLTVWFLASELMSLPLLWVQVAVLLAAMPSGITAFLFADRYDAAKATVTTTVVLSSALSLVTIPAVIYLSGG